MNPIEQFENEKVTNIQNLSADDRAKASALDFMVNTSPHKYTYNFNWLGRPIIQYPQDIVAMQELIWSIQPDLIIETGIAHGGSLIFYASMLELNAVCGGPSSAEVLSIDIDIRSHNQKAIESHPLFKRVSMIQGSRVDPEIIQQVKTKAANKQKILVCLDSNHTHDHVLAELEAYAMLTTVGSYCIVFDTAIEDLSDGMFENRPWGLGNNPKTAVWDYLKTHPEFEIDQNIHNKLLITVAPDGYLRRIK